MSLTPFFFQRKDRSDKESEGVIYQHNLKNKFISLLDFHSGEVDQAWTFKRQQTVYIHG